MFKRIEKGKRGNWSMAVNEKKDMGASVLARLKKQSRDTGLNYQSCLQLFAQEEFLRRLELSGYADNQNNGTMLIHGR